MNANTTAPETTKAARKQRGKARAHGEGSVYREHSSGMWVAAVDLGIVNGRRRRKRLRFATQQEARVALTRLRKSLDDGIGTGDDRMTVRAFLERWLRDVVNGPASHLRPGTRESRALHVRKHLIPGLGHHTLAKLSPLHVQTFLSSSLAERGEDGDPARSPRTVQYWHATLKVALKQAERWGFVSRNVARLVDPVSVPQREAQALTTDQAGRLLAVLEGNRERALFSLALALGMRRGELVGLRWEHVDLESGVLRVREQLQRLRHVRGADGAIVERKGLVVADLKTDKSRRTLRVPASVLAELREHSKRQKAERLKAGSLWVDSGYVFTTALGAPVDGRNVLRRWKQALEAAGLPDLPFHSSRHTAASFLLAHGAELRTVMGVLGHSQIGLTANLYTHMIDEIREDAATRSDAAFRAVLAASKRTSGG